ncbi:uncharacterized protein LOC106051406 isoform X3 [Biomphalaria glabrata]|uniref:Uncharacterized protein LOC106051406 isoform X3 n=1 Tax=Biomphalaria glabrata TaxID=6526 RepID=A0A9W2ZLA5_BIOGL|nr:uncharacterized protein LOC106051406 isoform X3 [Biomphalaria glabrata]
MRTVETHKRYGHSNNKISQILQLHLPPCLTNSYIRRSTLQKTFPEKWCIFRTIEFLKQGSPVKVFSDSPNSRISFNSSSGIFTVNKAGTYLVFGSISIISINQGIQLLGLHRDNTALVTCPSDGLGIVRADNVEKSQKKRYCNMNGVLKLELGDQLQLKTMVPNLQLLLDLPESISWLLLTEI